MSKRISINPVTRLEGHGKIDIFVDEHGTVQDAFWQVAELRGFEEFCIGRPAEEMPRITASICGVCPSAHHMASTKALDRIFGAPPPPTAVLVRRLEYNAFFIEDHLTHFFFLAAPDFILGPGAAPGERNILGVIGALGRGLGRQVIDIRRRNRDIIRYLFGKAPHPVAGVPGGVPRPVDRADRDWIIKTADDSVAFIKTTLRLFKDKILHSTAFADLLNRADPGERQEKAKVIVKIGVVACDRLAGIEVFGLQPFTIGGKDEFGARFLRGRAVFQRNERFSDSAGLAYLDVDIAGLKYASKVGFVGRAGAQPLDRRRFVPERLQEGIGKFLSFKRLISKVRYGFFNLNGVQRLTRFFFSGVSGASFSAI